MNYSGRQGKEYQVGRILEQNADWTMCDVGGGFILKEYAPNKRTQEAREKIEAMLDINLSQDALNQLAWPVDIAMDNGNFVGYIMRPTIGSEDYGVICSNKYNFTLEKRIVIAMNLVLAVHHLHCAKQVCGDLSPKNIVVNTKTASVKLINTETFQITSLASGKTYPCTAGVGQYIAPELQEKASQGFTDTAIFTKESDLFALSVNVFAILMNNCHPFSCENLTTVALSSEKPSIVPEIKNCQFAFYNPTDTSMIPDNAPRFPVLPNTLQNLFVKAFVHGSNSASARASAEEWFKTLGGIRENADTNYPEWAEKLKSTPVQKVAPSVNIPVQQPVQPAPQVQQPQAQVNPQYRQPVPQPVQQPQPQANPQYRQPVPQPVQQQQPQVNPQYRQPVPQQAQPTRQPSPQKPAKKKSSAAVIIIVVVILLLMIIIGVVAVVVIPKLFGGVSIISMITSFIPNILSGIF